MEFVRILKKGDDGSEEYKRAKKEYDLNTTTQWPVKQQIDFILKADKSFQDLTGKENYTAEDLKGLDIKDPNLAGVRNQFVMILADLSREELAREVNSGVEHYNNELQQAHVSGNCARRAHHCRWPGPGT